MAREFIPTTTIGADTSVPGQVKFFIKEIPGSLPNLDDAGDGDFLTVSNGEAIWASVAVAEDTQARESISNLSIDVATNASNISDLEDRATSIEALNVTQSSAITSLQSLYNALNAYRKVPATGGNAGQALIIASDGTSLTFGNVASSGGGTPGSVIFNGTSAPSNATGINGDYYLNTTTSDFYAKESGSWVLKVNLKGTTGTAGTSGSQILQGTTAPASGTGVNGDWYLNTSTSDFYQKVSGTWTLRVNIKGAQGNTGNAGTNGTNGTNGAKWYSDTTVPANTLGADGDYYLRNSIGDVYLKASGVWAYETNIRGIKGNTGASWSWNGNGDSYFQTPAATVLQTPTVRNGATVVFHYASDGVTFSTTAATFPLTMTAHSVLRARASGVTTWASAAAVGS